MQLTSEMGRAGRGAAAAVVFWLLETGCCCWTDLAPSRCDAGILCAAPGCCTIPGCCVADADNCAVVCGAAAFRCSICCCGCLCCTRLWRCWTAAAFAFATTLRLARIRICLAADCPSAPTPWSDGRFVASFTASVAGWSFAGGNAANLRARCSNFFFCSISMALADCPAGTFGPRWLSPPDENLFLWNNYRSD